MDDQGWKRPELRRELLLHRVITDIRQEMARIEGVLDELAYEKHRLSQRPPVAAPSTSTARQDKRQRPAA